MSINGFAPWRPDKNTKPWLDEVLDVLYAQEDLWPLTQRYWLCRLIATKGWLKVDEYSRSKADPKQRHLCTKEKNLNNILNRGRRSGLIPWEAISGSRGTNLSLPMSDSPEALANLLRNVVDFRQWCHHGIVATIRG